MTNDLQILIDYHKEQAEEAVASNEYDQARLHFYLESIARQAKAQTQENPA